MKHLRIIPSPRIDGEIAVPGDKSISHRGVILGSLAAGPTRLTGFLPGEDCLGTLHALQSLGVQVDVIDPTTLLIEGVGRKGKFSPAREAIDCGNSGTGMRLLAGFLAGQPFKSRLFGDASLSRRPMKRIIDPLTLMGAKIRAEGEKDTPPLLIEPSELAGIAYASPVASAQVKSAILLAGLFAKGATQVTEPLQSRDHTERMLQHFHAPTSIDGLSVTVRGGAQLHGEDLQVPGDFSSAAFWLAAAAAAPGSHLVIRGVGLNPTRTGLLNVLIRMGAQIREHVDAPSAEPFGTLQVLGSRLHGIEIGADEIPNIIDEIPIIAVAAALAEGRTVIRGAQELRVKESDRLRAMATNLRAFGVPVEETADGLVIEGGYPIKAARVESFGDHRIAMASAILALSAGHPSRIDDTGCIETSYPGFARHLEFLTQKYAQSWPERTWYAVKRRLSGRSRKHPGLEAEIEAAETGSGAEVEETYPVIALDGPAASGKSSVASRLAKRYGFAHVSTGSIYRAVTWQLVDEGIDVKDAAAVAERATRLRVDCRIENGGLAMTIEGRDPLPHVRDPRVNGAVSPVSAVPEVRRLLLEKQRSLAGFGPLVIEGRDIGTVVFPETPYKFFIDADPEVRAKRRAAQGEADSVTDRDKQDSARKTAPLKRADDAVVIDTTKLTLEQSIDAVAAELEKMGLLTGKAPEVSAR